MADKLPDFNDDENTPRWVYFSGIAVVILVFLFVVLHLTGNGLSAHTP